MTVEKYAQKMDKELSEKYPYRLIYWKEFQFEILNCIKTKTRPGNSANKSKYNDAIIMCDTETSKIKKNEIDDEGKYIPVINYICAWSIAIRAYHHNIVTLYGFKPSEMVECIEKIMNSMPGDETIIYFHNLGFDWWFGRKLFIEKFGKPINQLNVKPYCPVLIKFEKLIIKDSLILAQRSIEKWADDLKVEHKKAVGKWDYEKIRHQNGQELTDDEKMYIENDVLAGVECLDATFASLNKQLGTAPLTATGIPREQIRKRGKEFNAHDEFVRMAGDSYLQYVLEMCFHGGYSHGNRKYIDINIKGLTKSFDFATSYGFSLLTEKYPAEKFTKREDCRLSDILNTPDFCYIFKLTMVKVELKNDDESMPTLQLSKCIKCLNPVNDNGRLLSADYVEIYLTNVDAELIAAQYKSEKHICTDVYSAYADYLPRWLTDYIFECFGQKTRLKGGDPTNYSIAKSKLNAASFGMMVQKPAKIDIIEDSNGDYVEDPDYDPETKYEKYVNNKNSVLPYAWGVFVTSYAQSHLFDFAKCCKKWIYSDTDSVYGQEWDLKLVEKHNEKCVEKLKSRGYGGIYHNGRFYYMGIAESEPEKDEYIEFKTLGAKRYAGRLAMSKKLNITIAGVPKNGAECLKNDINNFKSGFVFDGKITGKKSHVHMSVEKIYINENGDEIADSIDLIPCDYELDGDKFDIDSLMSENVEIQIYEEE